MRRPGCEARAPRRRGSKKAVTPPATALVQPLALGRKRSDIHLQAEPMARREHYGDWLERQKIEAMMMSKLNEGARFGYEGRRRQWCAYRKVERPDPWLRRKTREERMADEDAQIGFCILLA